MVQVREKFESRGLVLVGLTPEGRETRAESEKWLKKHQITWPNGFGAGPTLQSFGLEYFPTVWVIGRNGKVVWNSDMSQPMEEAIEAALAVKPASTASSANASK